MKPLIIAPPPAPKPIPDRHKDPLEASIEGAVCQYAQAKKLYVHKFMSKNHRSSPDRIFGYKGVVFFIEFKRKGRKLTAGQQRERERLLDHGFHAFVCDNVDHGTGIIDQEIAWIDARSI